MMGMIQIRCHQIAFLYFTACFVVYLLIFFCRNYPVESMGKSGFLETSEVYQIVDYGEQDNYGSGDKLSPKSLILLKLHLVERDFNGNFTSLLRGYAFSRCHDQYHNASLPAVAILVKENNLVIPGVIRHNGLTCPWQWSPKCNWNTFYVEFDIPSDVGETIKEVTFINLFTKQMAAISVTRPVAKSKEELMVCVPPLYWYNNHLQLFIFVETWRLQGASHFIFYYSTVSMDVFNLLKYYEAMGIVSMIPFKSLPMNKRINPNVSIYRYGHILAINDCLLRRKAKFATVVDVDEFLVPVGNKTFVDFVNSEFNKDGQVAVLYFQHSALHFDLKKINDGFGFLLHTRKSTMKGPTKYVAVPERIRNVDSHAVSKIFGNYTSKGIKKSAANLLHSRASWAFGAFDINSTDSNANLLNTAQVSVLSNNYRTMKAKLNLTLPFQFQTKILKSMQACLHDWRSRGQGCKVPNKLCSENIKKLENWMYSDDVDDHIEKYHIL